MKPNGILNPDLLSMLACMGHTDYVTICDKGFPIPKSQSRVDLSLIDDIPTVIDVLTAVQFEFVLDRVIVTDEMKQFSPERYSVLINRFPTVRFDTVTHLEFKYLCAEGKGAVRTGDTCSYANVILVSG